MRPPTNLGNTISLQQFCFIRCRKQHLRAIKYTADLPLLKTIKAIRQKPREPRFWEVIRSFVSLAYASLTASRDLLQWLVVSISYVSSKSMWKPWRWMRLDLTFTISDKYNNSNLKPFTKFSKSSRSSKFKDVLRWNISHMIKKIAPISTKIVIS